MALHAWGSRTVLGQLMGLMSIICGSPPHQQGSELIKRRGVFLPGAPSMCYHGGGCIVWSGLIPDARIFQN